MDAEERRAAAIIAASFQASSPDEAVTIAEHYATWIEHGVLGEEPRTQLGVSTGRDLDDEELEAVRQQQQESREQRRRDKEAAKHAVRGEP
jgi:hypothetical protein